MAARQYQCVGPDDIREAALPSSPAGTPIRSADDLLAWIAGRSSDTEPDGSLIATLICVGPIFLKNGTFPWHRVYNLVH